MNERRLGRLLRGIARRAAPLPSTLLALACSGTTMNGSTDGSAGQTAAGSGGSAVAGTDAGGSKAAGGSGGNGAGGEQVAGGGHGGVGQAGAAGAASGGSGGASGGGVGGLDCQGATGVACLGATPTVPRGCVPADAMPGATSLPAATCITICGSSSVLCSLQSETATTATVSCPPSCAVGRRPAGFCPAIDLRELGGYFANLAELEAASVDAFRILHHELCRHRAPKRLQQAAARAARDEIRHARATRALARRAGGKASPVARTRPTPRSLADMARENAVEGCVRETFGALLATFQASQAVDPVVRSTMQRIARDETRHAALSWQVQRWLETRLTPAERAQIVAERSAAARELVAATQSEQPPGFAEHIGLPDGAQAHELASRLSRELWT